MDLMVYTYSLNRLNSLREEDEHFTYSLQLWPGPTVPYTNVPSTDIQRDLLMAHWFDCGCIAWWHFVGTIYKFCYLPTKVSLFAIIFYSCYHFRHQMSIVVELDMVDCRRNTTTRQLTGAASSSSTTKKLSTWSQWNLWVSLHWWTRSPSFHRRPTPPCWQSLTTIMARTRTTSNRSRTSTRCLDLTTLPASSSMIREVNE